MRSVLAVLSACAVAAGVASAAAVASPPNFGTQYYIKATMSLPYAGIVEPIESWFDTDKLRVDYYGGMDSYVYRADLNVSWQANPQDNVLTCTTADGAPSLNPYFPDLTGFAITGDAVQINDQMCDDWQLVVTTLKKTSTYDLYISRTTGIPVRYQMMGYDSLIGSHFDLYQLDYQTFLTGVTWNSTVFDQPMATCGTFKDGATVIDAQAEIAAYFPGGAAAEGSISDEYAAFLATHNKAYETEKELRTRQMQFNKHSHFINAHMRRHRLGKETYTVGLNFLADHTAEELAGRRGRMKTPKERKNNAGSYHLRNYYDADLPDSIDWRTKGAVTRPQDQGICGSCWSFGSTGTIEGSYFLKYGQLKTFAEQELMDCSWGFGNNACDGGLDFQAYDWVMQNGGMSFKENYGPYLMQDGYCQAGQRTPDASIKSYVNTTEFSVPALQDALASIGPISVSIDASHPGLSFYTGGVYYDPACGSGLDSLDHSVLAVGYGTDPVGGPYWIVRNNWSEYWGVDGYILMSSTNNNCGVASTPTYVILN